MTKVQLRRLEANVNALQKILAGFGRSSDLAELLKNIRRPGWTTPAEFLLVNGTISSMTAHAKLLGEMQSSLLKGARAVR